MKARSRGKNEGGVPMWIGLVMTAGVFGTLLWLERRRPLRRATESKLTRDTRNLTVAVAAALVTNLAERPLALRLARRVEERRLGLLKQTDLPRWLEATAACALLDYTLYLWHYLTHKVGFLWRCHVVHHADLDMDVTTALRFHFAELLLSVPFRLAQVRVIGASPFALTLWQTLLLPSVMFHHSNLELPIKWERRLNRLIVTPRMHGIHHSTVRAETDSNWSSGLTLWDILHGTLRLDVPQHVIVIGVPAYRAPEQVRLGKIIVMPFVEQPDSWRMPEDRKTSPQQSVRAADRSTVGLAK
jgi:sterol desaturase/sphingolipid hydroxylase (fatty acid hydroxylase superfamily)